MFGMDLCSTGYMRLVCWVLIEAAEVESMEVPVNAGSEGGAG